MLKQYILRSLGTICLAGAAVAVTLAGCTATDSPSGSATTQPAKTASTGRGRAELWAQTCNRCHNAWSPDQYSATQWEAAMQHMRLRAGLSREEHDSILEFLQANH